MMVKERFTLDAASCETIRRKTTRFGFGSFGEATYYRSYSRLKPDGMHEGWADTVIRVTDGVLSIRKNHYFAHGLEWDDAAWQPFALRLAETMFEMKWLPPGRGLWAMGTEYVYERGGAALNSCGAVDTADLARAAEWAMDMLMCGVGVGFNTAWRGEGAAMPDKTAPETFCIPDSREGWTASVRMLIGSYTEGGRWPCFDYRAIRPEGAPIRGFGGRASGPGPLKQLHERIESYLDCFCSGESDATRCTVDIFNAIGACVVAGNVRRSAQIALGSVGDETFLNLKNYTLHPEREEIGWISNNTVVLSHSGDFDRLPEIARHIGENGEPGVLNLMNVQRYGRYGSPEPDRAWLANPCAEIPLESYELCNLAEAFPTRCEGEEEFYEVLELATFYASTVALLATHRPETNTVMERNRRIGVSLSGLAEQLDALGAAELTRRLRRGYTRVKKLNGKLAKEAGVSPSVRVTTVKPSGTISLLAGVSPGMHFPLFRYAVRRMRVGSGSPFCTLLKAAEVPSEPDRYSDNTTVFEFPVEQGDARNMASVPAREQFEFLALLQREWSDNMVSCTVSFDPEREDIQALLAEFLPVIKSVSLLPRRAGLYNQMPYEEISQEAYERRVAAMSVINWKSFRGSGESDGGFCSGDVCGR